MTGQRADARKRAEATGPHTATLGELRGRDDLAHVRARHIGYWAGLGWGTIDEFYGQPNELEVEWHVIACPQCDGGER